MSDAGKGGGSTVAARAGAPVPAAPLVGPSSVARGGRNAGPRTGRRAP